jgi:nitrite reductase (NADH) small subunit
MARRRISEGRARSRSRRACRLADVPEGRGHLLEVGGRGIALFRVKGEVYAIENACPHREGPLAFGDVREGIVHCPVHAWPFDLATGRCLDVPGAAVRTYRAWVEGDEVWIEL